MTPPIGEEVLAGAAPQLWVRRGWRWWRWKLLLPGLWRRFATWPPLARLEAGVREMVTMPNLLDDDPLQEISLFLDRRGVIHVHHPQAQTPDQLILVANVLLKASQVVAAQAGAQVVSQPHGKV